MRREWGISGGVKYPHPDREWSGAAAEAQKLEITAGDHGGAVADEIAHRVAEWRGLPVLLGDALDAEQGLCDLALAGAMLVGVDGAQHHLEASSLLCGHALIGRNAVAGQVAQQAIKGGDAIETVAIERDSNRYRIVGPNRGIGDQMQTSTDLTQEEMEFAWRDPLLTGKEVA